jgi:hypothetical protein
MREPRTADADERDYMASAYIVGGHGVHLGVTPTTAIEIEDGLAFGLAPTVSVVVTWLTPQRILRAARRRAGNASCSVS